MEEWIVNMRMKAFIFNIWVKCLYICDRFQDIQMLKEDSILWSLVNIQIEEGKKEN